MNWEAVGAVGEIAGAGASLIDAGYSKLRTLAVSYRFPRSWASWMRAADASITVSAENIATLWLAQKGTFDQTTKDREREGEYGAGSRRTQGLQIFDTGTIPPLRRFLVSFRVTF